MEYFEEKNLKQSQYGFTQYRNTTDATDALIRCVADGTEDVEGVFVDLEKSFDCVKHSILIKQLKYCGTDKMSVTLTQCFLEERCQCVGIGDLRIKSETDFVPTVY